MTDPFEQLAADAVRPEPTPTMQRALSSAALLYRTLQQRIATGEALLTELHEQERQMREVGLPALMQEFGLHTATLADGTTLAMDTSVHAKLSEKQKPAAYAWLREHGYDEVIKSQLTLRFGKGEDAHLQRTCDLLAEAGTPYDVRNDVHPQTYKALIRELLREGLTVPLDTLGVFTRIECIVKHPNEKIS